MQRRVPLESPAGVTEGDLGERGEGCRDGAVGEDREFRAIFELAGSGKAIADPARRRLVRVNRRFCEITGYTAEELLDREVTEITHPADRARDAAAVEAALRGETDGWNIEKRYVRKDGLIAWVVVTGNVLRDAAGAPVRTVATVHDITARKRIEEDLRASEALLRLAQRAAHAGVWELDLVAGTAWMSRECHALYGTALAARGPDIASWRRRVVPEDAPAVAAALTAAVERAEEYSAEFRIHHPALGERWIWEIGGAEYDASGAPVRVRGIALDVTERKHGEQALLAADRRKDHFLAVLSHELRNPLAPMWNALGVLERPDASEDTSRRAQAVLQRQLAHLSRLVDDLLDLTRISRGKIQLRPAPLGLTEVVRRAAEDHRPLFAEAGVALDVRLPDAPVPVSGDATRLTQIVGNLLLNAVKFTPRGGHVLLELTPGEKDALLRVRDTGVGMDGEMLARLFEPFAQAEVSLERSRGGLGLGLALVRSLAELHGGHVWAHSDGPGAGAEFLVRLPIARVEAAAPPVPTSAGAFARRRILVVDDNVDAAETLRDLLVLDGHEVAVAHDGEAAVERIGALRPEIVFCDIGLPKLDGYGVARACRDDPGTRGAYLVALTGYALPDDLRRATEAGFDEHLAKPPPLAAIEAAVRRAASRTERSSS
ncbi:PAS domain-containing protein [Anaeromyxobacter sp. Fw109-5]|uniref:PAS domain-containing hybrid sensor histidine kinase/response regulator n=1 Tax=Anaeromyxobacter sp. (strain Fw109-5) TaxID=404589 RepID=UPI0000ED7976|nr:PAS domain-containing protein [Anaeromyxobacter sp. Fw109-5]ABS24743.1 PAS/PAC sensor hybrid histidine kinase [Anaeromyxobacter sp. Fw109-5]